MNDDDRWMPEHGYTISSPYEPDGSGELNSRLISIGTQSSLIKVFTLCTNFSEHEESSPKLFSEG